MLLRFTSLLLASALFAACDPFRECTDEMIYAVELKLPATGNDANAGGSGAEAGAPNYDPAGRCDYVVLSTQGGEPFGEPHSVEWFNEGCVYLISALEEGELKVRIEGPAGTKTLTYDVTLDACGKPKKTYSYP